jgi:putative membrane protein
MSAQPLTLSRLLGDWTLDPLTLVALCLAASLYGWGALRCRGRWPAWRTASFMAGLSVVALALLSGMDRYADELLSAHVLQHMLLILAGPALVLWGAPIRLALNASPPAGRHAIGGLLGLRAVRFLTRPACGLALFALVVLGTHLTGFYEAALRDPTLHSLEHAAYFWSGMLLLAPILAADPIPHRPGPITRFSWLMAAMVVMSLPAGVFLFDERVRYSFYLAPAQALHSSALSDQRSAGMLMLVGGGIVMGVLAIAVAMGAMLAEERRQRRRDAYLQESSAVARAQETAGESSVAPRARELASESSVAPRARELASESSVTPPRTQELAGA